ncbi:MAG TPA: FixH family protein [Chloroflexota bacterium]
MHPGIRVGLGLVAAALVLGAAVGRVAAHATFERSEPAPNAILARPPAEVRVWFSEDTEPRFDELRVFEGARHRVDRDNAAPLPGNSRALSVGVGDLAPGTYTVSWKTVSAVDGHVARGAFPFTVGLDQPPAPAALPGAEAGGAAPSPWAVVSRWLNLLTAVLLVGPFVFLPRVLGAALRAALPDDDPAALAAWEAGRRRGLALAVAAAATGLGAAALALVVQAATAADMEPWQALGSPLGALLGTRYGAIWAARVGCLVALGGLALRLRQPGVTVDARGWLAGLALGAGLLAAQSATSHAAATEPGTLLALGTDWVHLAGAAIWLGGLVQLTLALPAALGALPGGGRLAVLAAVLPRFSTWAIASVAAMVVSGLYQAWAEVGDWDTLVGTAYGQTLLVKLALVLPLVALGAVNLLVVSPRVARATGAAAKDAAAAPGAPERALRRAVGAEVALGAAVLAVVGLLTSLEPGRDVVREQGLVRTLQADDVQVRLRVAPGVAGLNTVDVALAQDGRPVLDAQRVLLRFTHHEMDMGTFDQTLSPGGDGHYRLSTSALSMAGDWTIEVVVRLAGRDDVSAALDLPVAEVDAFHGPSGTTAALPLALAAGALAIPFLAPRGRPPRPAPRAKRPRAARGR